jgi:hypothetical protein
MNDDTPQRKAFEKWISVSPYEREIFRYPNDEMKHAWPGQYQNIQVQIAWEAWQKSAEIIKQTLSDPAKVHVLMLRGTIATTTEHLKHLLGDDK